MDARPAGRAPLNADVRLLMPWYIALAFIGYAALLIWQITITIQAGRKGLAVVPFLLMKIFVFYLALSYWEPTACQLAKHLGLWPVGIAGGAILGEGRLLLMPLLLNPKHPMEADNLVLALAILATLVIPVTLLYFVGRVVLTNDCAI
jgi:hypothetical protein